MKENKNHILLKAFLKEFEKARLVKRSAKRYELTHDSLADKIAEKRNAYELAYVEAVRLLKSKYRLAQRAETKDFFTEKQLLYIEPFVEKNKIKTEFSKTDWVGVEKLLTESQQRIDAAKEKEKRRLEKEKRDLLDRQKLLEKNQRNQRRFIYFLLGATAILAGLFIYAFILQNRLMHSQLIAADELKVQGSYVEALKVLAELDHKFSSTDFKNTVQEKRDTILRVKKWMERSDVFFKKENLYQSILQVDSAFQFSPDGYLETVKANRTKFRDDKVIVLEKSIDQLIEQSRRSTPAIIDAKNNYCQAKNYDPYFDREGVLKKEINSILNVKNLNEEVIINCE